MNNVIKLVTDGKWFFNARQWLSDHLSTKELTHDWDGPLPKSPSVADMFSFGKAVAEGAVEDELTRDPRPQYVYTHSRTWVICKISEEAHKRSCSLLKCDTHMVVTLYSGGKKDVTMVCSQWSESDIKDQITFTDTGVTPLHDEDLDTIVRIIKS